MLNYMKRLFYLLLLISFAIFFQENGVKGQTYEEKYNLNFRITNNRFPGWSFDPNESAFKLESDTTDIKLPLKLSQAEHWGFRELMDLNMFSSKNMLLPTLSDSLLKVKISYRSKNLETARLFVYSLNQGMEIFRTDSICLQNCDSFREDSLVMNVADLRFLFFRLQAIGTDSTYTENKISQIKRTIPHELLINRIELQNGEKNINNLALKDIPISNIDQSKLLTLSTDSLLTKDQLSLMSKRITALGETVHGSKKITRATCEFIKSSIQNNQTSLVLTEMPLLMMLFFNKYIQGSNAIDSDKLKQLIEISPNEVELILELAKWMREYNKGINEKVVFLGMDSRYEKNDLELFLKDYLQTINKEAHSSIIESLISVLDLTSNEEIKKVTQTALLAIIEDNKHELTSLLGFDINIITFYLKNLLEENITKKRSYYERDYFMSKNVSFLIDSLCKPNQKVIISCHLWHANYLSMNVPLLKPFGYYMKKKYKNDYTCIAQIVYQDSARTYIGKKLSRNSLPLPSPSSLEAIFSKSGIKYGYLDVKELDEIVKLRMQGLNVVLPPDIESYINAKSQIEGVLFIK